MPNFVEDLHDFLVDDEDDGHVHADPTKPRDGAFVEPGDEKRGNKRLFRN